MLFLKILKLLSRKHLNWGVFLINLQAYRSPFLLKRDSNTGVFLKQILRTAIFVEHLTVIILFQTFM